MKHVFVETNFLVEVLGPLPTSGAARLLDRASSELVLHVPWCCFTEARRTLPDVITRDLGFERTMLSVSANLLKSGRQSTEAHAVVQALADAVKEARARALADVDARLLEIQRRCDVIPPTPAVLERTVTLFPVKELKPWDEMVLGAVLAQAEHLHEAGHRDLYFCNLNRNDFAPAKSASLKAAYDRAGIEFRESFDIP